MNPNAPAPLLPDEPDTFRLKTDCQGFYLFDPAAPNPPPHEADAPTPAEARLERRGPSWLVVSGEGDGLGDIYEITLTRHLAAPPAPDPAAWPLQDEARLSLPSGVFEIRNCPEYYLCFDAQLPPGTYWVRFSAVPAATTSGAAPALIRLDLWPA